MSYGIDYSIGQSNFDPENGIHYGVIPQNDILQFWADSAESYYGEPTCPKCGNEAIPIDSEGVPDLDEAGEDWEDRGRDYACLNCRYSFWSDEAFGDEAIGYFLEDGEYKASGDSEGDVWIYKSPYYTHAKFCSPCAPGACYLREPVDSNGPKTYCFAPDWFDWYREMGVEPAGTYNGEKTSCPYPVYRVSDGVCIYQPNGKVR